MASVNKVILIGNLGKNAELRYTPNGTAVTTVSLATTDRFRKDKDGKAQTEWHKVVIWGKQAEALVKREFLTKGKQIYVEGRLQTRSWDEKDTGKKRYTTEIHSERVELLGARESPQYEREDTGDVVEAVKEPTELADDDIPF
jgi:single-strand DNA-binding protein